MDQPLQRFLPWSIAACLALACAGLVQLHLSSRAETELFRNQAALADLELRAARQQLEAERLLAQRERVDASLASLQIIPLTDAPAGATAIIVWNPSTQEGLLHIDRLPPASNREYRLQATDPAYPDSVDVARFQVSTTPARVPFRPTKPLSSTARFTLTPP